MSQEGKNTGLEGLLHRSEAGVQEASTELVALVTAEIRRIAPAQQRDRGAVANPDDQLAYLLSKLVSDSALAPDHRAPFLIIYARAVRRVVCDYLTQHGGSGLGSDFSSGGAPAPEMILAIDAVLNSLERVNARLVSVVECLYFALLTEDETAAALCSDVASVQLEWARARAWLLKELTDDAGAGLRQEVSVTNAVWVDAVLRNAVALPGADRGEFLEQCHAAAPGLRKDVEDLLRLSDPSMPGPRPGDLAAAALWSCLVGGHVAGSSNVRHPAADAIPAGDSAPPVEDVPPRFGPWRVIRDLGGRPMGDLYLVERDRETSRAAARILPVPDTAGVRHQFARECRTLSALRHPRIAGILESGVTPDFRLFIIRDYVEGPTIDRYCNDEASSLEARVTTVVRVCSAVQQAHRRLVAHGALSASNIFVNRHGDVTLVDCGIAPLLSSLTATDQDAGWRPASGSPEQLRGEAVTVMSDVYQLGVLLRELLTAGAWSGGALPADLDAIVGHALRDDPDKRYPSVSALRSDLQRWLDRRPVWARRDTRVYRAGKFYSRRRVPLAVAAAAVMVGALVVPPFVGETTPASQGGDRAEHVNRLLAGLLAPTDDPSRADPPTARAFVDQAAAVVRRELAAQPVDRARLLLTIGKSYTAIGHYQSADDVFEEALGLRRAAHGDDALDVAEVLESLGRGRLMLGRYDEAETSLRMAVAIRTRRLGASDPATLSASVSLGAVLASRGHLLEAEPILRSSVDAAAELPERDVRARALATLGWVLRDRGSLSEGATAYRGALALYEAVAAASLAGEVAATQAGLALLEIRRSDLVEAEALLSAALPALRRIYHPTHPLLIEPVHALARLRIEQGGLDDARAALQQAERIQPSLERFHLAVPATRALQAELARRENRMDDAVASARLALEEFERLGLPDHPVTIEIRATLGDALVTLGRGDEAVPVLGRAIATLEQLSPTGDERTVRLRASLLRATSPRTR